MGTILKKGLIVSRANYPIGSWSNRIRMIAKGLIANEVDIKILITHPWPTIENIKHSETFVEFITKPYKKKENIISVFSQLHVLIKLNKILKTYKKVDFIILTGDRFLDGYVVKRFCKKNTIKLYADVVDEIGRKYDTKKWNIYSQLAILNRSLFNLILKDIDRLYVLSCYLYAKFKNKFSNLDIVISSPTFVNEKEFVALTKKTDFLNSIIKNHPEIENKTRILYAGSAVRPNGLFFSLYCISEVIKANNYNVVIILLIYLGNIDVIKEKVKSLNLQNNVILLPATLQENIPSLYNYSDILILPEQGDIIANAGFPGKVGEYLISGKAIISTRFSDLDKYLINNQNCLISEIGDSKTYITNLNKLISDKFFRKQIGLNAKETGLKYFDYINASKIYIKDFIKPKL